MKSDSAEFGRPERFLLLLARSEDGCRGKAVRVSDGTEFRFTELRELQKWLEDPASGAKPATVSNRRIPPE